MACFSNINVQRGSVATYERCDGIFNFHLTANFPRNLPVKKFKSVKIWQNYGYESVAPTFLTHPVECYISEQIISGRKDERRKSVTNRQRFAKVTLAQFFDAPCTYHIGLIQTLHLRPSSIYLFSNASILLIMLQKSSRLWNSEIRWDWQPAVDQPVWAKAKAGLCCAFVSCLFVIIFCRRFYQTSRPADRSSSNL